ncbi:2-dehydropantoate 2-reductase [Pseudoxanthomonas yeongjuensis]|uniref:2-dehydropantoate 2-reductase n=1 Tax=Pseudoxanthomonas yeongjuensis TaxID=377616 RepID=UPI0013918DA7|nr:2-dehydropantoate 2-reductase [Pseudoxanthomonas yeongjuensis]KAF1713784.1 2-dehydropantoate 2-reductase [Pseudoxanthomonas yeongjuensis]
MRILVLGAGGTGGYFGGRLAQSGADVTFLVRPARSLQLEQHGLQIRSPLGDADFQVAHVVADKLEALATEKPFDLVLLSCKAYDLDSSLDAIAPAVGERTTVMPILNGLLHYAELDARFGRERVLGGLCFISATKGPNGEVMHLGKPASITFGERDGDPDSACVRGFANLCARASLDHLAASDINQQLWNKYTFLTTLAAGTCLMRADVGTIVAGEGGRDFMQALYRECLAVAEAAGQPVSAQTQSIALGTLVQAGSPVKASMLRDLEAGQRVEAAHIVGDMLHRARSAGQDAALLATAWCHLQAYEAGRAST